MKLFDWLVIASRIEGTKENLKIRYPFTWTQVAQTKFIEEILGKEELEHLVDLLLKETSGNDSIEQFLKSSLSEIPTQYLWKKFQHAKNTYEKESIIKSLVHLSHPDSFAYIAPLLNEAAYAYAGIDILDNLVFNNYVSYDQAQSLIEKTLKHQVPYVREKARYIRRYMRKQKIRYWFYDLINRYLGNEAFTAP